MNNIITVLLCAASVALHELGHAAMCRMLGLRIVRCGIEWRSGSVFIDRESGTRPQNIAVSLAGPAMDLLLFGITWAIGWKLVAAWNLASFVWQMLPIRGHDGYNVIFRRTHGKTC